MEDHELIRRHIRDMILGLDYLHANDIIHGDIKPENLLLTKDHHLRIADFGVSFMLDDETCPNKDGKISRSQGTPAFTAPETGSKSFSAYPIDVWAMGVTLYMMITGICPFAGNGIYDTYEKIQNENPPIPQNIDENMKDFLEKILLKDPTKRISIKEAMIHPWITKNGTEPLNHPIEHNNHKFEKRISVTKQDIEYAVSFTNDTIRHLRKASIELEEMQQIQEQQGTKKRDSIEDDKEKKEEKDDETTASESELSDYQITQQPPKQNNMNKIPKKPTKKLPDKVAPAQQESTSKKTIKKKNDNMEYNPFSDSNNQNNIIVNMNQETVATYTSKPIKIELSRSDTNPIINKKRSNKKKKQSVTPNPTTKKSNKIKSKKTPKKPSRIAPVAPRSRSKSPNKRPEKPAKTPPIKSKSKSKSNKIKSNGSRKSTPNVGKKKKKMTPKTKALPPSLKKEKNNNNDLNQVESGKNISPSFVKRRRSSEKKSGNKIKLKGSTSPKKKGKAKVAAPKKGAPALPLKNKPLPKSKNKVKVTKNPTN